MVQKDYRAYGIAGTLLFHGGLLAILIFFVLTTPNPPFGSGMGVELNYGTVDEGSGDVQTMNQANVSPIKEEAAPATETGKITEQEVVDNKNKTAPVKEEAEKLVTSEDEESEKIKEIKEDNKTKTVSVNESEKKQTAVKTENINKTNSNGKVGTAEIIAGNSNGDKPGKVGDQGNPKGKLEAKALYGNPGEGGDGLGGAGGNKLDLNGWIPAFKIEKKDISVETGKIVYQIKVDSNGELISIVPIEKTVSPEVEKFYRNQIEENWAIERTRDNVKPAAISSGTFTVFVRSK